MVQDEELSTRDIMSERKSDSRSRLMGTVTALSGLVWTGSEGGPARLGLARIHSGRREHAQLLAGHRDKHNCVSKH